MVISEKNLIIGKIFTIISDYSHTSFYWFEKQTNFLLVILNKIFKKIYPKSASPPIFI